MRRAPTGWERKGSPVWSVGLERGEEIRLDNRAGSTAPARAARPHLHSVDLVRLIAVAGVIAVHSITLADPTTSAVAGSVLVLLHTSREIFFAVTALVLAYQYREGISCGGRHAIGLLGFWRHRYLLVVVPYATWTVIYFVADGLGFTSLRSALVALLLDLLTGAARYHLYFLLVTMQLYLVAPLLLAGVRRTRGHHRLVFLLALAYQLTFSAAHHAGLQLPGAVGFWVANPDALLPSYLLFIATGALLGDNLGRVLDWLRRHTALSLLLGMGGSAVAIGAYAYQVRALGHIATEAAEVFQPAVTVESLTALLLLLAVGAGWGRLRRPRPLERLVGDLAGSSFGIYLAHPLVLQTVIVVATTTGLLPWVVRQRQGVGVGGALLVLTPLVLLLTWALVLAVRRGPLSLPLTGRPMARPRPAPLRAGVRTRQPRSGTPRNSWFLTLSSALVLMLIVVFTQTAVDQPAELALASSGVPLPTRTAPAEPTPSATPRRSPGIQTQLVTIHSGGLDRQYQVLSPNDPESTSLPVIVFLHGVDATIQLEEARDGLEPYVHSGQAILVYPAAENEHWDTGEDQDSAGVDDVAFLRTVLEAAARLPDADPSRVFLAGFSRGGRMAWEIACQTPQLLAGLVVIAAVPLQTCSSARPLPLLQLAGTDDSLVPYASVTAEVAAHAARNGCRATPTTTTTGPAVSTYNGCQDGDRVVLVSYEGEDHVWPGGDGEALPGPIIWSFIAAQRS